MFITIVGYMSVFFFIPPLFVLAYLAYRNTRYGLYIVLATIPGYLLRTEIWIIPTTWLELAIYVVSFAAVCKHLKNATLVSHSARVMRCLQDYAVPVCLLLIAALVSAIISNTQASALGILKAWFFDPLLLGIIFIDQVSVKNIRTVLFYATFSTWPIILYGLYEYVTLSGMTIFGRLDSFYSSPNYVAMYIVPLIVFVFGFRLACRQMPKSYGLYFSVWIACALITLFFTKSFGGWFGLIGGTGFLLLLALRFTVKKLIVFLIFFAVVAMSFFYISNRASIAHFDRFWQISSFQTRKEIWTHSLALVVRNPFFGVGLADFSRDYEAYIKTLPRNRQPVEKEVLRPHNVFLDFWLETGILGLIAFLWIIFIFYYRSFRRNRGEVHYGIQVGASAALTALLLHGFVDTPYFKNDLAVLFWLILALSEIDSISRLTVTDAENKICIGGRGIRRLQIKIPHHL